MPDLSALLWPMVTAFGALVLAGIGFPLPEEIPTVVGGIWVVSHPELGVLRWLILPVCFAGVILSDLMLYTVGRLWGPKLMEYRWIKRLLPAEKRAKIEHNFSHYGVKILLLIRWLPAIRSPMFITAGIMRVPLLRFILADGIAAVVGHSLLFFLAYWFGDQFKDMVDGFEKKLDVFKPILVMAAIVIVAAYFVYRFLKRPVSTADPAELPLIGGRVAAKIEQREAAPCQPEQVAPAQEKAPPQP